MTRALTGLLLLLASSAMGAVVPVDLAPGVSAEQLDAAFGPRKIALVIGIGGYDDPLFTELAFARADARSMAELLGDPLVGGYDVVLQRTAPADTTRAGLQAALAEVLGLVGPKDTLLVYVSGHGTLDLDWQGQPDLFLAVADTRKEDLPGTALRVRELQDAVGEARAGRKVLILDACHHGAGKSSVPTETMARLRGIRGAASPLLRQPERGFEAHLFASTFGLPALEDAELGHGVYTWYLMQALTAERAAADVDGDGLVSVAEAHDHARDATIAHTGAVQVPRATYQIVGREQIFLAGDETTQRQAEQAMLRHFDEFYAGCSVEVDGRMRGLLPKGVPLPLGEHVVTVRTPGGEVLGRRRLKLRAGQVINVADIAPPAARVRLGVQVGPYFAMGPAGESPLGGPLVGVQGHLGYSPPGRGKLRLHVRADLGWHGGRHAVQAVEQGRTYDSFVNTIELGGTVGMDLRVRRFGLVAGPRIGALALLRPALDRGVAEKKLNRFAPEAGLLVEPSVALSERLMLSLSWTGSVTPGVILSSEGPPAVLYSRVQGGLTWTF